jgi:hypothetical protein
MAEILLAIVPGVLILVAAVFTFTGRGLRLMMPGYRSLTGEQRAQLDGKALRRVAGGYMLLVSLGFFAFLFIDRLRWLAWASPMAVLAATGGVVAWVNRQLTK